jgi:hypothetical protein
MYEYTEIWVVRYYVYLPAVKKAVPLQAWNGPEEVKVPRFLDNGTVGYGGKFVRLTHRPPLPPRNTPGTQFC